MKRLDGKIALVTGASSGIGEATALRLAEEGATVVAAARRAERLQALVERIHAAGGKADAVQADIAIGEQIDTLVRITLDRHGRIDILVNNAGVMLLAPIQDARVEDWRRMVELNLLGLMQLTHAVLPGMRAQGSGHIVNLSSLAGRSVMPGGSVYSVTKFGVNAFTEALRKETVKQGIRVTVIEPGPVATELIEHVTDPASKARITEVFSSIEQLQPEDVAEAIAYAVTAPARVNINEILLTPTDYAR